MEIRSLDVKKRSISSASKSFVSFISTLISNKKDEMAKAQQTLTLLNSLDKEKEKELVKKRVIFKTVSFLFCFLLACLVYKLSGSNGNKIEIFSAPYFIIILLTLLYFKFHNISKQLHKFTPSQQITREEEHLNKLKLELDDLEILASDYTSLSREFNNLVANMEGKKDNNR